MTLKTTKKVYDTADTLKPYVERAMADEKLRSDVLHAFTTARKIYGDLIGKDGKAVTVATRVATDEDIREQLASAIDDLRSASDRLKGKKDHGGRNKVLLIGLIALAILYNPFTGAETRRFVKEMVTGEPSPS